MPCIPFRQTDGRKGVLCMGGPIYRLTLKNGREIPFEMHPRFGPWPLRRDNSKPRKTIPKGFWEAFEQWQKDRKGDKRG